jgi:hypothetical protein
MKVIPLTLAPDVPVYFDAQPEEARAHTAYLAMNSAAVLAAFATIKATGRTDAVILTGPIECLEGLFPESDLATEIAATVADARALEIPNLTLGVTLPAAAYVALARGGVDFAASFAAKVRAPRSGVLVLVILPDEIGVTEATLETETGLAPGGDA